VKRKIFSILFALVVAVSLTLVPAVVSASPDAGDVTIVVYQQDGTTPIEGAQVRLFWGAGAWKWMAPKFTDAYGSATFTATEISTWRSDNGSPTMFQANASDTNGVYGNVYTWAVSDEMPCITYSASTEYTFTYNLVMFQKQAPTVVWGTETVTVTYTLGEALTAPLTPEMGFFHGPFDSAPSDPIFQAYPKAGGGYDFYYMIDTDEVAGITVDDYVAATMDVTNTLLSATTSLKYFAGIDDNIIAVPFLVKTPVEHTGLTEDEKNAAEDMYGVGSSITVGLMTLSSEAIRMTASVPAPIISISVSPLSVDFGSVYAGSSSATKTITVTNTSPILSEDITADVINESRANFYGAHLTLDGAGKAVWKIENLGPGTPQDVSAVLTVPADAEVGTLTATLVFWAEEAE